MKICLSLATVCLLAATAGSADYEAAARAVLANILAKDYAAAAKNFDAKMMTVLPPATLKQVFETQIQHRTLREQRQHERAASPLPPSKCAALR
jgi:hypothetical protein